MDSRFYVDGLLRYIGYNVRTLNTQDAHWPHRSSEKTVHKNMKTGQYVFTIS